MTLSLDFVHVLVNMNAALLGHVLRWSWHLFSQAGSLPSYTGIRTASIQTTGFDRASRLSYSFLFFCIQYVPEWVPLHALLFLVSPCKTSLLYPRVIHQRSWIFLPHAHKGAVEKANFALLMDASSSSPCCFSCCRHLLCCRSQTHSALGGLRRVSHKERKAITAGAAEEEGVGGGAEGGGGRPSAPREGESGAGGELIRREVEFRGEYEPSPRRFPPPAGSHHEGSVRAGDGRQGTHGGGHRRRRLEAQDAGDDPTTAAAADSVQAVAGRVVSRQSGEIREGLLAYAAGRRCAASSAMRHLSLHDNTA